MKIQSDKNNVPRFPLLRTVSYETVGCLGTTVLKGGYMAGLQSIPRRPERPPIYLISQGGEIVENPTSGQIADEIHMTIIPQLRVIYELFMGDDGGEDFMAYPKGVGAVANTLFSVLERWDQLSRYL